MTHPLHSTPNDDAGLPAYQHLSLNELVDSAPVLIWASDIQGQCQHVNRGWLEYVGRSLEQELGLGWTDHLHPEDREATLAIREAAWAAQVAYEVEYRLRRRDGVYRWIQSKGVPRFDSHGEFQGFVGSCIDITDRKQAQMDLQQLLADTEQSHALLTEQTQRLHELAERDPLTGVYNRRSFRDQFEREWSRSARHERPLSCIMLDIDFFKKINDTHGHAVGDAVLKYLAKLLQDERRPSDQVCRWGGEEFCIMVPETTESGAATLAERVRSAINARAVPVGDKSFNISSSFGVAERTEETDSLDDLIERADQALHIAKHSGRNRVVRYDSESAFADLITHDSPTQVLSQLTAADLLTPTPCVHCDETIERAIELLLRHGIGSAPVIDDMGKLVGFISERDLMLLDVSSEDWLRPVREVMKTNVVAYEETTIGSEIFGFLCRVSLHRVVVVKHGRPLGIVSPSSILKCFKARVAAEATATS